MKRIPLDQVDFRDDLYPRIDHDPALVQRYQDNLDVLPPIEINQHNILIDGWHRWTAHRQAKVDDIAVVVTETASDNKLLLLSARRNAAHGKQMSNADKKKLAVKWYAMGIAETELIEVLSVGARTLTRWLSDKKKSEREERNQQIARMWLAAYTLQDISDMVSMDKTSLLALCQLAKIQQNSGYEHDLKFDPPPLYDVWTAAKASNKTKHPGMSEASFVDNLVYMYTEPGNIVIDPFAGGGSTIDVCRKRLRRVFASDLTPIPARENEIRQHDITDSLLKPPQWKDVSLVYLDPPYGAQVAGKYSDKPEDLANGTNEAIAPAVAGIIKAYMAKLRKGAHIALIIQSTQWHAENRLPVDHVWKLAQLGLPMPVHRIQAPYSTQQATPQMVDWAKENRDVLGISREIVVWRNG